jgi:ubiquinone/menaquinone biosynthesis C-methylase UbiE
VSVAAVDGSLAQVREDFDRIALLPEIRWDQSDYHRAMLLREAPGHSAASLDVGCGTGAFARLLAERSDRVLALDLSPNMIAMARSRSLAFGNIDYEVADVMSRALPSEHFDCVASLATVHHLPLETALMRFGRTLRPGGVLLILDVFRSATVGDLIASATSYPVAAALRWRYAGRLRPLPEVRAAWKEHGRHDRYSSLREMREVCARVLPGARVRRHLLWRYSLVWRKPGSAPTGSQA